MFKLFTLYFLCSVLPGIAADYVKVKLSLSVPDKWEAGIREQLEAKLNAVPDVLVVEDEDEEALFTIQVDVNSVSNKSDETIGYSLAALIYGTYDQKILKAVFDEAENSAKTKEEKAWMPVVKYAASGNVFVAAFIHTHGSTDAIGLAFDQIVGKLKSKAIPEYRRMEKLVATAIKNDGSPKARPVTREY